VDKILENVAIAPMTTLGIGGPARFLLNAATLDDVLMGLEFAVSRGIGVFILGGGSNLLVADRGIDALVIKIAIGGLEFNNDSDGNTLVTAGAGVDWDEVVEQSVTRGLAGLECLSGIPGLVGGTPIQNVGAYSQDVSETIISVKCLDRSTGTIVDLANRECEFTYRTSIFNTSHRDRYIVLGVTYALRSGGAPKVVYTDLIEHFRGSAPTIAEVRNAVLAIRRSKSMVIDSQDPNSRSAGSFFKNPVVDLATFEILRSSFGAIPSFPFADKVKIPAAWLIENSGFKKGYRLGNAGLSTNHTLALINRGNATASELIALKEAIEAAVKDRFGIALIPEPVFAGFDRS
jgi:UDP-N-acetylmuramate dehydrogenase